MNLKRWWLWLFCFLYSACVIAGAQITTPPGVINVATAPSGNCTQGVAGQKDNNGIITTCQGPFVAGIGTWAALPTSTTSGFPITIGSTSIATGSTTTIIAGLTLTAPTFTTPTLGTIASGNIAAATGLTPGQVTTALGFNPGAQPNVVTTSTFTFSGAAGFYDNENSTAGTAVTGTLPTASVSPVVLQYCFDNANNGSAANTGVLTFQTSATGQYIIFTDGTLSASGGYVSSGGAARDAGCVRAVDSTHWMFYTNTGTWTKH